MAQATQTVSSSAAQVHVTGRRVLATIVDVVLIIILEVVIGLIFGSSSAQGTSANVSVSGLPALLFFVLVFAYYVVFEGRFGQTVGKMALGIKVVRDDGGAAPGYAKAAIRTVLRIIDGIFFYLVGFVVVLISGKNQRLGDMAAHTLVVRK